jgi:hypothetical protein
MPNLEQYKEALLNRPMNNSDSLSESPGTWVRVKGTVESAQPIAAGVARIQADDSPAQLHYFTPGFTLRLSSGQAISVKTAGEVRFLPEAKRRAPWGQLESEEVFRPLAKRAPGPHIEVSAEHSLIHPGDTVEIFGQIEEDTDTASYRNTGKQLSAATITSGASASKLMEDWYAKTQKSLAGESKKKPFPLGKLVLGALALVMLLVAYRLFTFLPTAVVALSFTFGVVFYVEFFTSKDLPPFYCYQSTNKEAASKAHWMSSVFYALALIPTLLPGLFITGFASISMIFIRLFHIESNPREMREFEQLAIGFCAVVFVSALFQVLSLWLSRRSWKKFADIILNAKPFDPNNPDAWAAVPGVLRDTTPVEVCGRESAIYFLERTTATSSANKKSTSTSTASEQDSRGTFFLDTMAGTIEVDPTDAIWSSTTTAESALAPQENQRVTHNARLLAQRDFVLAVGRVQDQKMYSTGPQSLFLFGDANEPKVALEGALRANTKSLLWMIGLTCLLGMVLGYALLTLL